MIIAKLLTLVVWMTLCLNWLAVELSPELSYTSLHYAGLVLIAAHCFELCYFLPKIWATDKPFKNGVLVLIYGIFQVMSLQAKPKQG